MGERSGGEERVGERRGWGRGVGWGVGEGRESNQERRKVKIVYATSQLKGEAQ